MRMEKAITIGATGVTTTTAAVSAGGTIPLNLAGLKPRYVRVTATGESFLKFGVGLPTATGSDMLVQPADSSILSVGSNTHFAVIQGATVARVNIIALEDE